MNRKRILFVEQNQDGTVGGSHVCLLHLVRCLDRTRYDPIVAFYEKHDLLDAFHAQRCPVVLFEKPLGKPQKAPFPLAKIPYKILQKGYNCVSVSLVPLIRFVHFIRRERIDMVHLNNTAWGGWEWLLACKLLGRRCITHERGFARYGSMAAFRARRFDKILCVSKAVMDSLHEQGIREHTTTLYDGMSPADFSRRIGRRVAEVRKEFGLGEADLLIGMVGNFQEWKGQRTVVRAMDALRKDFPGLVCLLVGDVSSTNERDREFYESVRNEIVEKGLAREVVVTGFRRDVPDLMNAMDIVLHASIEPEPFGMVVLEAMSLRKPVIATDIGGPREIIEDGVSGYLVPPCEPHSLAEKISLLLRTPRLRAETGERALRRVETHFDLSGFSRRINSLYSEIFLA